jgi:hypothetical protein
VLGKKDNTVGIHFLAEGGTKPSQRGPSAILGVGVPHTGMPSSHLNMNNNNEKINQPNKKKTLKTLQLLLLPYAPRGHKTRLRAFQDPLMMSIMVPAQGDSLM